MTNVLTSQKEKQKNSLSLIFTLSYKNKYCGKMLQNL